jgi:hypothetical protein
MTKQDKEQLWIEIEHIFDSGANEMRVFNMVEAFIEKRYPALRQPPVMVRSEQLPCSHCGRPLKEHSKDSKLCPDRMKNFEQGN